MSLNTILSTSVSGLTAARVGMDVTSHNIANANVEGYSRQRAQFSATTPQYAGDMGYIGLGVSTTSIERIRDQYLDEQIYQSKASLSYEKAKAEVLDTTEILIDESSELGMIPRLSTMFDLWNDVSKNPENSTKQALLIEGAIDFSDYYNQVVDRLNDLKENTQQTIEGHVVEVNDVLKELGMLNQQLEMLPPSDEVPNDLLDKRDLLVDELSEFLELDTTVAPNHVVTIYAKTVNGNVPIDSNQFEAVSNELVGGKIKGYQDALVDLDEVLNRMDQFAADLTSSINTIHEESGGGSFYVFENGKLEILEDIISGERKINVGDLNVSGDGGRAYRISALSKEGIIGDGQTGESFLLNTLVDVGSKLSRSNSDVETKTMLLSQLENKRESISGVSLDEETVNMMTFQTAYEANAKVVSIVQDMFDTLIGMVR